LEVDDTLTVDRKREILQAWMDAGNTWHTAMELWLRPENTEVLKPFPIPQLRYLVQYDLLEARKHGYDEFWVTRYRVSKIGKQWLKRPPQKGASIRVRRVAPQPPSSPLTITCEHCDGIGINLQTGTGCSHCNGEGCVPQPDSCPECEGVGVLDDGKECSRCSGSGEWKPAATMILTPENVPAPRARIRIRRK